MALYVKAISSLEKCFMDQKIEDKRELKRGSALLGEEYSFELAYTTDDSRYSAKYNAKCTVESPLSEYITVRQIEQIPVRFPAFAGFDDYFERKTQGLYPDILEPLDPCGNVFVRYGELRALWISVNVPKTLEPGDYPIEVSLSGDEEYASTKIILHVVGAVLPKQKMCVTEWFHTDCIADYYELEVFSEKHWDYIYKFMKTAVENGLNTILTPVFTPPLDTAIGGERTTVQLTDVRKTRSGWNFGFDRLERWVRTAKKAGMKYFEISHLYTQWGAAHAPKIMGRDEKGYHRLFGWETEALSEEYREFLRSFIKALLAELRRLGIDKKCFFHVSDEPSEVQIESYRAAKGQIADILDGYTIIDALSSFDFYKKGVCATPIVSTNNVDPFLEAGVKDLWVYYACGNGVGVSNRFIAMPMARTRIIGAQFWKYRIAGFLQWGYNFYNSAQSIRPINPYMTADGEFSWPAGDPFAVYPGRDGIPLESMHMKAFTDALQDRRAMDLAEKLAGREAVLAILENKGEVTFSKYPHDAAWLLELRDSVNALIEANI